MKSLVSISILLCLCAQTRSEAPPTPKQKHDAALRKARETYVLAFQKAEAQLDRDYREALTIEMQRATPEALERANALNAERKNHAERFDVDEHPELEMGRIIKDLASSKWLPFTGHEVRSNPPIQIRLDVNGVDTAHDYKLTREWVLHVGETHRFFRVLPDHWRGIQIHSGQLNGYVRESPVD